MVRWLRWHCPPDTGFEIRALAVWGRASYLSVTEAPHNTNFHTWMGKKQFCFFQTAETGNRTPDSGVKGSGANHYPRAPALYIHLLWTSTTNYIIHFSDISFGLKSAWNRIYTDVAGRGLCCSFGCFLSTEKQLIRKEDGTNLLGLMTSPPRDMSHDLSHHQRQPVKQRVYFWHLSVRSTCPAIPQSLAGSRAPITLVTFYQHPWRSLTRSVLN